MRALVARFVRSLLGKARKFAQEYTVARVEATGEDLVSTATRWGLALLLAQLSRLLDRAPYLSSDVTSKVRVDLDRLVADLIRSSNIRGAT